MVRVRLNGRERFKRIMHFEKPDRFPLYEWLGYWRDTLNRWYGEGLPHGMSVEDYFGFDKTEWVPIDFGPIPRFVQKTLEEDGRYRVEVNEQGIKMRVLKTSTSMPSFLDFPVKNKEDFEKVKKRFNPKDLRRYPMTWSDELIDYYRTVDHPIRLRFIGFFWQARNFMGLPNLLTAFYREPRLIHDIFDFWADFLTETAEEALEAIRPDYVDFAEDMSYKNGHHISPRLFAEFILPCYKRVTSFLRRNGVDVIAVDTDGDPTLLIPLFLEGGVNCLIPLEAAAGMNAKSLRKKFGRKLLIIGNIDKRALGGSKGAVKKEVTTKYRVAREGGYIPSVDHSVSLDISFQNYSYYIDLRRKYQHEVS